MDKKLKITWLGMMAGLSCFLVVSFIIVNYIVKSPMMPLPEVMVYYLKIIMTLMVLGFIPLSLKYVNKERYDDITPIKGQEGITRYSQMCFLRLVVFLFMGLLNIIVYIATFDASFFYLAVIILLAIVFMRGK